MSAHASRLKVIEFAVGEPPVNFEIQISSWTIENNTPDGTKVFTYAPDGEFREEVDADYALTLTAYADWRSEGISEFLVQNDGQTVGFTLDHHPDIPEEHVQWAGKLVVKAPPVGGDVRTTETLTQTFQIIGKPAYMRVVTP